MTRTCRICGETKSTDKLVRNARAAGGFDRLCTPCNRARNRRYYKANRERAHDQSRRWRERNPEDEREAQARWRHRNADRKRRQNRRWATDNAEAIRARNNRRRAREANAEGSHSTADWLRLLRRRDGRCAYCGEREAVERDHVIPLVRGGSDYIGNILPACTPCNRSKGTKLLIEWEGRPRNRPGCHPKVTPRR